MARSKSKQHKRKSFRQESAPIFSPAVRFCQRQQPTPAAVLFDVLLPSPHAYHFITTLQTQPFLERCQLSPLFRRGEAWEMHIEVAPPDAATVAGLTDFVKRYCRFNGLALTA